MSWSPLDQFERVSVGGLVGTIRKGTGGDDHSLAGYRVGTGPVHRADLTDTFQSDSNHNVTQIADGATTLDFNYDPKGQLSVIDSNSGVRTITRSKGSIGR